jgi:hypothetical protein
MNTAEKIKIYPRGPCVFLHGHGRRHRTNDRVQPPKRSRAAVCAAAKGPRSHTSRRLDPVESGGPIVVTVSDATTACRFLATKKKIFEFLSVSVRNDFLKFVRVRLTPLTVDTFTCSKQMF